VLSPTELQRAEMRFFALASELFDLETSGWLRRQVVGATRTMLKLLYHGAASKKVVHAYHAAISTPSIARQLNHLINNVMWPGGKLRVSQPQRPWAQQRASRDEARSAILAAVGPTPLASLLGRDAAEAGVVKLHDFLQVPVLARSLAYTLFDLLLARLFPGIAVHGLPPPPPPPPVAPAPAASTALKVASEGIVDAVTGAVPMVLSAGGQLARVVADAGMAAIRSGVAALGSVGSGGGGGGGGIAGGGGLAFQAPPAAPKAVAATAGGGAARASATPLMTPLSTPALGPMPPPSLGPAVPPALRVSEQVLDADGAAAAAAQQQQPTAPTPVFIAGGMQSSSSRAAVKTGAAANADALPLAQPLAQPSRSVGVGPRAGGNGSSPRSASGTASGTSVRVGPSPTPMRGAAMRARMMEAAEGKAKDKEAGGGGGS
jgi:hypothetical protein